MNEEERRELIARQHRALYSNEPAPFLDNGGQLPHAVAPGGVAGGARGASPLAYDHFGMTQNALGQSGVGEGSSKNNGMSSSELSGQQQQQQQQPSTAGPSPVVTQQSKQRSRANSNSSPSSNPTSFSLFENNAAQQSSRTSASSPGGSPPRQGGGVKGSNAPVGSGVGTIGTRPHPSSVAQAANSTVNKQRSTTPLPSPLSYGFAASEETGGNERSTSAASNPTAGNPEQQASVGWGSKSAVWGNNKSSLGVQASVWG